MTSCAPEVGGEKSQAGDPGWNRAAGEEEIQAGLHVTFEGPADAQHKREIDDHDQVIDRTELDGVHER